MTGSAVGGTDGVFPAVAQETVSGSAIRRYTYDGFNRLVSYRSGDTSAAYTYDAGDYRVAKQTTGSAGEGYTRYFYEGSRVVLEADADGAITAHNTYSINLASRAAGEEAYYYFYNAHGDVVGLSGAGGGEVVRYRYDAFGTPVSVEGDADNSITYAGYQYDEESGLYYLNARYYDSMTARFLTEDTYGGRAGDPLSLHRYTYCANNPLRYTDPSGHFFGALLRFVGGAVVGGVMEYVNQKFIEKREKVDWKAVAFEAAVGGVGAVFGGAGKQVAEGVGNAVGGVAKKVVKAAATEAFWGGVEDAAKQVLVDGKDPGGLDYKELFDTMAVAGVGGVFGAVSDFIADYRKHARLKKVPVPVEVERVHYECVYHVPDCKNHVNNIRVVTRDTKWEMQEVWEYGGTDRSFMDYLGDHAKEQVAGKAPEDAPWRKLNLQFFAEGADQRVNGQLANIHKDKNGIAFDTPISLKEALKELDASGLRPGQSELHISQLNKALDGIQNNYDWRTAESWIYFNGSDRYLVEGHHTTVAFEMLQKKPAIGMNAGVKEPPSVTGYYWTKKWYQFWRKTIKIIKD